MLLLHDPVLEEDRTLVLRYDVVEASAPQEELIAFFEKHGYSPDQYTVHDNARYRVVVNEPDESLYFSHAARLVWDEFDARLFVGGALFDTETEDLVLVRKGRGRRQYWILESDLERWVVAEDEGVLVSSRARVKSMATGKILAQRYASSPTGPRVYRARKPLYVRDLMQKYFWSRPGWDLC